MSRVGSVIEVNRMDESVDDFTDMYTNVGAKNEAFISSKVITNFCNMICAVPRNQ